MSKNLKIILAIVAIALVAGSLYLYGNKKPARVGAFSPSPFDLLSAAQLQIGSGCNAALTTCTNAFTVDSNGTIVSTTNNVTVGGVTTYYLRQALAQATTTNCALALPAATTTLISFAVTESVSSTTASTITFAKASTAFATTTAIGATTTIAANAQASIEASSTIGLGVGILSPSNFLTIGTQGGVSGGGVGGNTFSPVGFCSAVVKTI